MTDKFHDTIAFLEHTGSSIGCISETRLYGKGNKQYGKWKYIRGPECLPAIGVTTARLGLGMLVNTERFPDADVILHTKYTQWTALAGEATPVFVGVCYVPCGPEADRQEAYDDMEEAIARFENLGRVIIGGDFNARCGLNGDRLTNTAGRNLVNFCSQNALTMINSMPATTGKFSRIQRVVLNGTVTVQKSTIDYVLVPTVDESSVLSLNLCDADLESDHRPLVFTTTWKEKQGQSKQKLEQAKHTAWRLEDMTNAKEDAYMQESDKRCSQWLATNALSFSQPSKKTVTMLARSLVQLVTGAAEMVIGKKKVCPGSKYGFDDRLKHAYRKRHELCEMRKGLPPAEADKLKTKLDQLRTKLRSMTRSRRRHEELRRCQLIENAGSSKLMWKRWKDRGKTAVPEAVMNKEGELVTDPTKVLATWKETLAELGAEPRVDEHSDRCSNDKSLFDDEFAKQILKEIRRTTFGDGDTVPELERPITWDEIRTALAALPNGKAAGLDGVVAELLKLAGLGLALALTELFNAIWSSLQWPEDWRTAFLVPLFKDGSKLDPLNYRMIALNSVMAKLFEKVLDMRIREWSERVGTLSDLQGGFREGRGTMDQVFILHEIVTRRLEKKAPTLLMFVDVRKAYDRVWRSGLWLKLKNAGLGGNCLRMIREMYSRVTRTVLVNGRFSDKFDVAAGVPQGSVLSPFFMLSTLMDWTNISGNLSID